MRAGNVSVAIFELQGQELFLAASYVPAGTTPILLKIDSNRRYRVRSHFERLALQSLGWQTAPSAMASPTASGDVAKEGLHAAASVTGTAQTGVAGTDSSTASGCTQTPLTVDSAYANFQSQFVF